MSRNMEIEVICLWSIFMWQSNKIVRNEFFSNTNHSEKEIDVLGILGLYEIALFVCKKQSGDNCDYSV